MRKILCRALLCLCLVLALGPVHTAFAQDLDRIESYAVDVTPNTEDGSLRIQVTLEWTVLAEGPVSWVKIGVPNGSIRQEQALTDNIDRLSFDNSYMYVYFNRDYDDGETFRFSYSWIQEYMYTLGADGSVEYVYTPGWFNEARVGQMTLTWHDPAGVDGVDSLGNTGGDHAAVLTDLDHGQQLDFTVRYDSWPAQLAQEGSRDNLPQDNDPGYDPDYQDDGGLGLVGLVILLVVVFLIVRVAAASDGYRGGFGTHYVFVSGLWYPAGPDGRPRPGSHGTREKPKPPRSGGFGGGFRHLCLGALRRQVGRLGPQDVPAGAAGVVLAGQTQQFRVQFGQLCGQLLPCRCHGPGHGAVAFQRGGSLGAVLLACGDVLPQCGGALLVAGDVVFQHGDAAVAAGKLFCDAANIPIQALDGNGQLLCLHTDLLSLGLGGSGLPVKPLILGLSGLIVPHLTADGLPGAVDSVGPEGDFQRLPPGAELEKALGLLALFFQRADPGFQFVEDVPQTLEVLCRRSQTPLRLVFAVAVLGDAAGFLENFAALAAFCGNDLRDAALSDDGVAVPADAGVQQQLVDVLEAAELAVDGVLALAGAVVFAADDGFVGVDVQRVGAVVQRQAHHGKAHGSPAAGAAMI